METNRFFTLFEYSNGKLFNKVTRGSAKKGTQAGYITEDGYRRVRVDGEYFYVHQLVYIMCIGQIPPGKYIDHIDGNRLNNDINNLRVATPLQNQLNKFRQKNGTSIYKGVWYDGAKAVWKASIRINGNRKYLGQFSTEQDAAICYDLAAIEFHGEFAKLNILEMPKEK